MSDQDADFEDFEGYAGGAGDLPPLAPDESEGTEAHGLPDGADAGYAEPEVEPESQTEAEAIARYVRDLALEQLRQADPAVQAQRAQEAERDATMAMGAAELVERYPALAQQPVADQVIADAHRAAHELGMPQLAETPQMWRAVYEARLAGHDSAGIAPAIAQDMAKAQLLTGSDDGSGRGSRVLPFGG